MGAWEDRSKSLAVVAEPSEPPPQPVEMVHRRDIVRGWGRMGQRDRRRALRRSQLLGVMEIGRAAAGACLDKCLDAFGFAGIGPIGLQLGHFQSSALKAAA